jgi:hypothetical protein
MKTYTEKQGQESFDWNNFLDNPPEKGSEEHLKAVILSAEWVTCACGNLCDIIPRSKVGTPMDDELEILGLNFNDEIIHYKLEDAKDTIFEIEKRSSEVIAGLRK